MLDFSFDSVEMDAYGDSGAWGSLGGLRRTRTREVLGDVLAELDPFDNEQYRDRLDRSVVARLGVMCTLGQEWDGAGAAADRRSVAVNCPYGYSEPVWEFIVESAASRLVRREGFWRMHGAVAHALEREGGLTYAQVSEIVAGLPNAASYSGTAAVPVAASASVPGAHEAVKVADAAEGVGHGAQPPQSTRVQGRRSLDELHVERV